MSGFAALLKLSQTQTAQSELAVQTQIASRQTQLEKQRREQEAKERKEREREAILRAKRFEEQRKEEERKRKRAEEQAAREKELAKREEQMRDALKYGPRKASAVASGSSSRSKNGEGTDLVGGPALTREEIRARQIEVHDSSSVLTREEKRERKLAAELRRSATSSSRRSGGLKHITSLPDGRTVRRLPGGAVDYTTVSRLADPEAASALPSTESAGKSARERLAAMPSTLMKLNTVKRDVRSIDEILVDRAKAKQAKTLAGDEAKEFSDWFGKNKKKAQPSSQQQQQHASSSPSRAVSATPSASPAPTLNPASGAATPKAKPAPSAAPAKTVSPFLKSINPKSSVFQSATSRPSSGTSSTKKRPRSSSESDTPPPAVKRRSAVPSRSVAAASSRSAATSSRTSRPSSAALDISTEIWSIFGKDKKSYTARDVLSDDEDMEADAESVLKEEARSARLAHKEDEYALAMEKKHEEEKRRRKKERERKERA